MGCGKCWRVSDQYELDTAKEKLTILIGDLQCMIKQLQYRYNKEKRPIIKKILHTHLFRCIKREVNANEMLLLLEQSVLNQRTLDTMRHSLTIIKKYAVDIDNENFDQLMIELSEYNDQLNEDCNRFDSLTLLTDEELNEELDKVTHQDQQQVDFITSRGVTFEFHDYVQNGNDYHYSSSSSTRIPLLS